jgi:hypothetical protein
MSNIVGVVGEVYDYDTKVGKMYGMVVNGNKYGCGKTKPKASVGDTVSFRYTENGQYKNVDMKSFSVETVVTNASPPLGGLTTSSPSSDARQNSIVRQSSLEYAIRFVQVCATAEAIPGITKTTKPEDRYNIIEALVAEKADEFFTANISGKAIGSTDKDSGPNSAGAAAKAAGDGGWG